MHCRAFFYLILIIILYGLNPLCAQKSRSLSIDGTFHAGGVPVRGDYSITLIQPDGTEEDVKLNFRGIFLMQLELNQQYEIHFSKDGFIGNIIKVNTTVDDSRAKKGFPAYEMNIELRPEIEGRKSNVVIDIDFCDYSDNFDFKDNYRLVTQRHIKEIMDEIAIEKKLKEKAAKDSLAYQKLLQQIEEKKRREAEEKLKQEQLALEKARQDSLAKDNARKAAEAKALQEAREKARRDSLAAVQQRMEEQRLQQVAREQVRKDSIAEAHRRAEIEKARIAALEKARQDSLAKDNARKAAEVKALQEAREKARRDSLAAVQQRMEEQRLQQVAREQVRKDSIAEAHRRRDAEKARLADMEKARQDSLARENMRKAAEAKALQEEEARRRTASRKGLNADSLNKARFDSLARINAERAAWEAAERARIEARERARFDSIAKARTLKMKEDEAYLQYLYTLDQKKRDSLMAIFGRKNEAQQALLQREIHRFDSISRLREQQAAEAEAALREIHRREKLRFDSIAQWKKKQEELAYKKRLEGEKRDQEWRDSLLVIKKQKEQERAALVARDMARFDSIARVRAIEAEIACSQAQALIAKQNSQTMMVKSVSEEAQKSNNYATEFTSYPPDKVRLVKYKEPKKVNNRTLYGSVDLGDGNGIKELNESELMEYIRNYPFRIE